MDTASLRSFVESRTRAYWALLPRFYRNQTMGQGHNDKQVWRTSDALGEGRRRKIFLNDAVDFGTEALTQPTIKSLQFSHANHLIPVVVGPTGAVMQSAVALPNGRLRRAPLPVVAPARPVPFGAGAPPAPIWAINVLASALLYEVYDYTVRRADSGSTIHAQLVSRPVPTPAAPR